MSNVKLKVSIDPGTRIEKAFSETVKLASKLNICVRFKFNDVECTSHPYGNVEMGVEEYQQQSNSVNEFKFAHARTEK